MFHHAKLTRLLLEDPTYIPDIEVVGISQFYFHKVPGIREIHEINIKANMVCITCKQLCTYIWHVYIPVLCYCGEKN